MPVPPRRPAHMTAAPRLRAGRRAPSALRRHLAAGALALATLGAAPAPADVFGLVIGIDNYTHIPKLRGAVNDALDIAGALEALPDADVTLLLDHDATRARIFEVWERFIAEAGPDDTIVVTFAGHGSGEPAVYPETEEDGQDETLLLAGYAPNGPDAGARIRDDEIAALIARTPDTQVVFVADACHSGTVTRASVFDLSYRFFPQSGIVGDPLPPPPPPAAAAPDLGQGDHHTFFGAVGDSEKAPEFPIGGAVRGALSYAFADGLRGAADHDGDGILAKGELEIHIRKFVKAATAGKQRPKVAPAGQRDVPLFRIVGKSAETGLGPFAQDFDALPPIAIRSAGPVDASDLLRTLDGVTVVDAAADDVHTLLVDLQGRALRSGQGDELRRLFGRSQAGFRTQVQETVDKLRGARAIQRAEMAETLNVWFTFGDKLYFANDPIRMAVEGREHPHISIFNLPSDGTVEWLYPVMPAYQPQARFEDPPALPPDQDLALDVVVLPPFGADHVIVIETPEPPAAVWRALARHHLGTSFRALWTDLHHALADTPHRVAVHAFFTQRKAQP